MLLGRFQLLASHEFCLLNFTLERNTPKIWGSKMSFPQCRCFAFLLWMAIKCLSKLPSLPWQELCNEYRKLVRNGKLPCTRENDPIQGPDGKMHSNTCSMCAAFLWVDPLLGKWGRALSFLRHFFFFGGKGVFQLYFVPICVLLVAFFVTRFCIIS